MDDHHYSSSALVLWCFWGEDQSKIPQNRQLDPYSDHNCDHTRCIESVGGGVNPLQFRKLLTCQRGYGYRLHRQAWLSAARSKQPGWQKRDGLAMAINRIFWQVKSINSYK